MSEHKIAHTPMGCHECCVSLRRHGRIVIEVVRRAGVPSVTKPGWRKIDDHVAGGVIEHRVRRTDIQG